MKTLKLQSKAAPAEQGATSEQPLTLTVADGELVTALGGSLETLVFRAEEEAYKLIARLPVAHVVYALDSQRGIYRGFAALHDVCDANMLLPQLPEALAHLTGTRDGLNVLCEFHNLVMEIVNEVLLGKESIVYERKTLRDLNPAAAVWLAAHGERAAFADYGVTISTQSPSAPTDTFAAVMERLESVMQELDAAAAALPVFPNPAPQCCADADFRVMEEGIMRTTYLDTDGPSPVARTEGWKDFADEGHGQRIECIACGAQWKAPEGMDWQ